MDKLDEAVNSALDDIELVENERFIELMTALYDWIDFDLSDGGLVELIDAIGHFVPSGDK